MRKLTGSLALAWLLYAGAVPADSQQALDACANATTAQKELARSAGYDIDALCATLLSPGTTNSAAGQFDEGAPRSADSVHDSLASPPNAVRRSVTATDQLATDQSATEPDAAVADASALPSFGYGLFAGTPTTFAPANDMPVPNTYVIGPGDSISIQLFGKINRSYELAVNREGNIQFPELGPIAVAGLSYEEMRAQLVKRIEQQLIGAEASITMGPLRSIRVFVLGEANLPGSYTVSALSTMTNALFVSGGIRKIGSLRNVQLKRDGRVAGSLDLYDLLLSGDTSADRRLQPGDVIFVPPAGKTAAVSGAVKRPAVYELKGTTSLEQLVALAGGFRPDALRSFARVNRIGPGTARTVVDVDLGAGGGSMSVVNGDLLQVYTVSERIDDAVMVEGHVYRPGGFAWRPGLRVSALVSAPDMLLPAADLDYALLVREIAPTREIVILPVNPGIALSAAGTPADPLLQARDRLFLFGAHKEREPMLAAILDVLQAQASKNESAQLVRVAGPVRFPGVYPRTDGMTAFDLIVAAGGLREAAYNVNAELTRRMSENPEQINVRHYILSLHADAAENSAQRFELQPDDLVTAKFVPGYQDQLTINIAGEVRFPGLYEFQRGETLSGVIERAGGFTDEAHLEAAAFMRADLRMREARQLEDLRKRLTAEVAAARLAERSADSEDDLSLLDVLLKDLQKTEATGRLVIDLPAMFAGRSDDVKLRDGDSLFVPAFRQEVTVVGEVQNPTSHFFRALADFEDYVEYSGGTTANADKRRSYVIRADGSVVRSGRKGWLRGNPGIHPGDTIVVPLNADRIDKLTFLTSVSQIIYQIALGAAAVNSF